MNTEKSRALFEEARKYIPGGVNSPVRAFGAVGQTPRFMEYAKGAYLYDADGNKLLDYVGSWGPAILGHAHPEVVEAVRDACLRGLTFGAPTELETELAKQIVEAVPAVEQVRLVSSGTEACMSAIRVARGYTGREKIVKFRGCYHGHSDGLLVKAGSGLLTGSVPDSAGVPKGYAETTLLAEFNDWGSVEALFSAHSDIAAVMVEPVAANMGVVPPEPGFLEGLREITKRHGALLIFDEVITGFRVSYGGAGSYYNVLPDLVCLGKIVGGGMPLAAYGGLREIMQTVAPLGPVYQAGTLSGNPVAVTAGITTLDILKNHPEIYNQLEQMGAVLEQALRAKGLTVNRVGSLLTAFFTDGPVRSYGDALRADTDRYARFFAHMLEHDIYVAPSQFEAMFLSADHGEDVIRRTVDVIEAMEL
ncbi:MAG: glutamate-1-semialdehyde 2,1-aminomutase [Oscillospiraceae bacterium]|nr:glutamate-1-semialdehyde 2,1-aminomutase [Oscillospiraceae bacterium]